MEDGGDIRYNVVGLHVAEVCGLDNCSNDISRLVVCWSCELMKKNKQSIILASRSARRSKILSSCGIEHEVLVTDTEECVRDNISTARLVRMNAKLKAMAASERVNEGIIIAADTLTAIDGESLGKPKTKREAYDMLKRFNGNNVVVYTGIAVADSLTSCYADGYEKTVIKTRAMDARDLKRCFELFDPYDKAGGFTIDGPGAVMFDNLRGSYFNVLGLGLGKLDELFKEIGYHLCDFMTVER